MEETESKEKLELELQEIDLRDRAIEHTVRHFKDKQVTKEQFMSHIEAVYEFLKSGMIY